MDAARWQQVERVLDAALAAGPEQWDAIIDRRCRGDAFLRAEVHALLAQYAAAHSFLRVPPGASAAALLEELDEQHAESDIGQCIGVYRVVRRIGRGGMSRVFLAERDDGQFEQRVALKLLRPDLDTELDHARFRAERQILASLNHPNIARLLDGGVTHSGAPYLVLEHVEGQPVTEYCETSAATLRQRLDLFVTIAEATQYAHRNLVVHRDLKPSNILVTADGVVKLLDFGLATLLRPDTSTHALATFGGPNSVGWLTPAYAAPEQLCGRPVTAVTDVYALGTVLYEMLTGTVPFSGSDLATLREAVETREPEPPSVVLARTARRSAMMLRGDLDAIVLKALRKAPDERYASARELADDVRHHLAHRPVVARRPTVAYRFGRLIQRHRVETAAITVVAISLVAAAVLALSQARQATAALRLAEAASRESDAVSGLLLGLFDATRSPGERPDRSTVEDLLRRSVARASEANGQPLVQARMLDVTGQVYLRLGRFADARPLLERAAVLRRGLGGNADLELVGTLAHLSDALLGLQRYDAADSLIRQALDLEQRVAGPDALASVELFSRLASTSTYRGDLRAAEAARRHALELSERVLGPMDSVTGMSHLRLGATLRRMKQSNAAEQEFRSALDIFQRTLGPGHPATADAILNIAYLLAADSARLGEAELLIRQALEIRRRTLGPDDPKVASALFDLSRVLVHRGEYATAIAAARQHADLIERSLGPDDSQTGDARQHLGEILYASGKLTEAEAEFEAAITLYRHVGGDDDVELADPELSLARVHAARGDYAAAEALARRAVRRRAGASGAGSPSTMRARVVLGGILRRAGRREQAGSVLRSAIAVLEPIDGRENEYVSEAYRELDALRDSVGAGDR